MKDNIVIFKKKRPKPGPLYTTEIIMDIIKYGTESLAIPNIMNKENDNEI